MPSPLSALPTALLIVNAAPGIDCPHVAIEFKQARLDATEIELQAIKDEGTTLFAQVEALVRAFADRHDCVAACTMDMIDREITSLVNDATGPAWRRKTRLEDEISQLQEIAS